MSFFTADYADGADGSDLFLKIRVIRVIRGKKLFGCVALAFIALLKIQGLLCSKPGCAERVERTG